MLEESSGYARKLENLLMSFGRQTRFEETQSRIILFSNPGAEIATRACLAARVAANCEAERYGEM